MRTGINLVGDDGENVVEVLWSERCSSAESIDVAANV